MKKSKKYWASNQFISGAISPKRPRKPSLESALLILERKVRELGERLTKVEKQLENAHQTWNGL